METLSMLEEKISLLLDLVKDLREKNSRLAEEKSLLLEKIDVLQSSSLKNNQEIEEEKALTKIVVDELIHSIDLFVKENQQ